ncbi:hypothetical protein SALBM311S_11822 [Streptomyces alboniger]
MVCPVPASRSAASSPMCSLRSCPTQNARSPAAVSSTARTASSSAADRTASRRATLVAMFSAFIASGRFSVIVASPSRTSYSTVSAMACPLRSGSDVLVSTSRCPKDSMTEIAARDQERTCDLRQRIPDGLRSAEMPRGGAVSQPHRRIEWFCSRALPKRCRLMLVIGS